jgi:hypothetical protein
VECDSALKGGWLLLLEGMCADGSTVSRAAHPTDSIITQKT